jgi:hypothetical protein
MSNLFDEAKEIVKNGKSTAVKITTLPTGVQLAIISLRRIQCSYGPTWMLTIREPGRFTADQDVWANDYISTLLNFTFSPEFPRGVTVVGLSGKQIGDITITCVKETASKTLTAVIGDINLDKKIVAAFQRSVPDGARARFYTKRQSDLDRKKATVHAAPRSATMPAATGSLSRKRTFAEPPPPPPPPALKTYDFMDDFFRDVQTEAGTSEPPMPDDSQQLV